MLSSKYRRSRVGGQEGAAFDVKGALTGWHLRKVEKYMGYKMIVFRIERKTADRENNSCE